MSAMNTLFLVNGETVNTVDRLAKSYKAFDESWVRDLIFKAPELLPIEDILSDAGVFLPIGIEVHLDRAGISDVFGVTTGGYPVVVETKLWRNPQARREVLAQTIDYIKEVAKFGYERIAALWDQHRSGDSHETLFEAASAVSLEELDEAEFIDRIDRTCRRGDILGFIVGDGIHHRLTELIDHLGRDSSHLRYYLTLLELRCFQLPEGRLAVLPSVVREVMPVERTYIHIEPTGDLADLLKIRSVSRPTLPEGSSGKRTVLTTDEFWEQLQNAVGRDVSDRVREFVDDIEQSAQLESVCRQRALMLKVPDSIEDKTSASVFAITTKGFAYNSTFGIWQAKKWGIPANKVDQIMTQYYCRLHEICSRFPVEGINHLKTSQHIPLSEFVDNLDEIASAINTVAGELTAERSEVE